MRKTKIICTMGPACDSVPVLRELIQAGMNIARLNMAHGSMEEQAKRIVNIRQAAAELGTYVPILMDIKGPEIRIGMLEEASYELQTGASLTLTTEQIKGTAERISVSYRELPRDLKQGSTILIDDGLIELRVEEIRDTEIHCRILNGGTIKPRKGVNLPGVKTSLPGVTEKDVQHIRFGVEQGVEIIAASFVRKAADILEIRKLLDEQLAGHIQIISKIENEEGVANLDEILEVSDGLMVARGDLGVEIPVEAVPLAQRDMIAKSNLCGKPVIVATHMLDSMQVNPRPTRAEVSDVANAVLQGADVVMLSGETAAGKYPIASVATMASIAQRAESTIDYRESFSKKKSRHSTNITEVISQAVVRSSLDLNAKAIIASSESGFTVRMVSKYRPSAPIIAITPNEKVLARLTLLWGVVPVQGVPVDSTDAMFDGSIQSSCNTGIVEPGDLVVVTAGVPLGQSGTTNLIKIVQVQQQAR